MVSPELTQSEGGLGPGSQRQNPSNWGRCLNLLWCSVIHSFPYWYPTNHLPTHLPIYPPTIRQPAHPFAQPLIRPPTYLPLHQNKDPRAGRFHISSSGAASHWLDELGKVSLPLCDSFSRLHFPTFLGAEAAEGCGHFRRRNSNLRQIVPPCALLPRLSAVDLNLSDPLAWGPLGGSVC